MKPCLPLFVFFSLVLAALRAAPLQNELFPVDRDIVVVVIPERFRVPGQQVPYVARPGDRIVTESEGGVRDGFLYREGEKVETGRVAGFHHDRLLYPDSMVGAVLDPDRLEDPDAYVFRVNGEAVGATFLGRQSKPTDLAMVPGPGVECPYEHRVYFRLEQPIEPGDRVEAVVPNSLPARRVWDPIAKAGRFGEDAAPTATVSFTRARFLRSPAVHVNHLGFRPKDPLKVGFLSLWLGNGGAHDFGARSFRILEYPGGEVVFRGEAKRRLEAGEAETSNGLNFTGTSVYECDFSDLRTSGTYVLSIDGVGASYPFEIADDVWIEPLRTIAEGFLTQRSGIELGPPETRYVRPRPFHQDDGLVIYKSTTPLMDTRNGLNALGTDTSNFANLLAGRTDEVLETEAWGGYFDAGDWDRRIWHLNASRQQVELFALFPEKLAGLLFPIPESGNGIPDVLNEALFNIDFYVRLQTPEGGVRGGIESEEHPKGGEYSWQESLQVLTYAPGIWSSYQLAASAAQINPLLRPYDADRASGLLEAALKAWRWAEAERPRLEAERESIPTEVYASRALAALHLFRATGESAFHEEFLEAVPFRQGAVDLTNSRFEEAAFTYAHLTPGGDPEVQAHARASVLRRADFILGAADRSGYGWAIKNGNQAITWGKSICYPMDTLGRAHQLTGDAKYLKGMILSAQYGAGANPYNQCMVTSVGHDYPRNPLVADTHQSANPPPGVPLYGPIEPRHFDPWFLKHIDASTTPAYLDWPAAHLHWDMWFLVPVNEYTMHETFGPAFYGWGYLGLVDQ